MKCPNCNSETSEGNSYCASCGIALKPESDRLKRDIADAVKAELAHSLRDRDVIEVKLVEAVMTRVIGWTKTFAIVTGVPLFIAGFVLSLFGYRTYTDFVTKKAEVTAAAKEAQTSIKAQVDHVKTMADEIKADSDELELERKARSLTELSYVYDAAAILKQLYDKHKKEELLFGRLVEAYVAANDVNSAVNLIKTNFKVLDPKEQLGTFVQAGHILMTYNIENDVPEGSKITAETPLTLADAEQMLREGEQLPGTENDRLSYKNLMGELALCYALGGKDSWNKAISYGQRWTKQSKDLGLPVKWQPPRQEKWTAQLDENFVVRLQTEVFKEP
jgi:hypothetical protein